MAALGTCIDELRPAAHSHLKYFNSQDGSAHLQPHYKDLRDGDGGTSCDSPFDWPLISNRGHVSWSVEFRRTITIAKISSSTLEASSPRLLRRLTEVIKRSFSSD